MSHRADRSGQATAYNLTCTAFPDGRPVARYRRSHRNGPWIYTGGKFQYVAGSDYPFFETRHSKVGLAMCTDVYMPEVTRALALRGAELIFMPAGLDKRRLWETWRALSCGRGQREPGDRRLDPATRIAASPSLARSDPSREPDRRNGRGRGRS
jgi:predicted amidohydrolase